LDRDALAHRRLDQLRVVFHIADDIVLEHEAVGVVTGIGVAGQLALPIGGDETKAVPTLGRPSMGDPVLLEDDMADALRLQAVAHREAGLAAADDDDGNIGGVGAGC
jgi:hypothetical protein